MSTFDYFGYGSNMLTERLTAPKRCPGAAVVGPAYAPGRELRFAKRSVDRSGKGTLIKSENPEAKAWGVVFSIPTSERTALDRAEGVGQGYRRDDKFTVVMPGGTSRKTVSIYLATPDAIHLKLKPYDWYLYLCRAGAEQHNLDSNYLQMLKAVQAIPDPDASRGSKLEAEAILTAVGFKP